MNTPDNFVVRPLDLPYAIKGLVALDSDGFANIYVNSRLSREEQRKAAMHEISHLNRNDFYSSATINDAEDFIHA